MDEIVGIFVSSKQDGTAFVGVAEPSGWAPGDGLGRIGERISDLVPGVGLGDLGVGQRIADLVPDAVRSHIESGEGPLPTVTAVSITITEGSVLHERIGAVLHEEDSDADAFVSADLIFVDPTASVTGDELVFGPVVAQFSQCPDHGFRKAANCPWCQASGIVP